MLIPGVPPLPPGAAAVQGAINKATLLVSDAQNLLRLFAPPQWGIFKNGSPYLLADTVASVAYKQDTRISDYPQELGAFQQYNKVGTPYEVRVRLVKGGTEGDRTAFLASVEQAVNSLDLFDVATPEKTYINANLERYDYERTQTDGAYQIKVDLWIIEIRQTASTNFTTTNSPSGSGLKATGTVQAQTPSSGLKALVTTGFKAPAGFGG